MSNFKESFEKSNILILFIININDFWIYFLDNRIYFIFDSKRLINIIYYYIMIINELKAK